MGLLPRISLPNPFQRPPPQPAVQPRQPAAPPQQNPSVTRTQAVGPMPVSLPAGFRSYQMGQARVTSASPRQAQGNTPDPAPGGSLSSVNKQKLGLRQVELVASGSFNIDSGDGKGRVYPAGTVIRNGRMDVSGLPKTHGRGAMAVLTDGRVVVTRQGGSGNLQDIQRDIRAKYGSNAQVRDYMGGGALLIEGGKAVSDKDLRERQQFDQGGGGISAQQMRRSNHVVVAQHKNGQSYVILAQNKTGAEIQSELLKAGFVNAVKFDGSSGYVARDESGAVGSQGTNVLGIAVDVVR